MKNNVLNITNVLLLLAILFISYFVYNGLATNSEDLNPLLDKSHLELTNNYINNLDKINNILARTDDNNIKDIIKELEPLLKNQMTIYNHLRNTDISNQDALLLEKKTKVDLSNSNLEFYNQIEQLNINLSNDNKKLLFNTFK